MTENQTRLKQICIIHSVETLTPTEEGVELNEGYKYEVDGTLPQLADSIAKLAIELDKEPETFSDNAGGLFVSLIVQFYDKLKESDKE